MKLSFINPNERKNTFEASLSVYGPKIKNFFDNRRCTS